MTNPTIRFIRRGQTVTLVNVPPTRTLLEVLREDLGTIGTKEGCGEGDCGDCTAVIGEAVEGRIDYRAINACIRLAQSIDGLALWTVEDLSADPLIEPELKPSRVEKTAGLHPVQQAMVQCHGSQCGFCSPGVVMSLFGLYQNRIAEGEPVTREDAQAALSGNLCRCTGYRPILDAAMSMSQLPPMRVNETELLLKLEHLKTISRWEHANFLKNLATRPRTAWPSCWRYAISFTATLFNQAGALVHVYTDGSVRVNHGGTEMGQGLHTKVAQIVADELGVPFHRVLVSASDTARVPNASATAASSGTDLNGRAAQFAARNVRDNLAAFVAGMDGCGAGAVRFALGRVISPKASHAFDDVVKPAYANRIQLWSDGYYRTPKIHYDKTTLTGRPFYYVAYGAACTEVVIDTLTGESRVLKVDILHDVGTSLNPAIDLGQIEGGFVQGMGWLTTEELVWDARGRLATHAPSTYKIPTSGDVPAHFKVDFWPEPNREDNVFGSKAVGEPPFMLAISVWEAMRAAVAAARRDGIAQMDAPATAERVLGAVQLDFNNK